MSIHREILNKETGMITMIDRMMDMEGIFIETETQVGTEISEIIMDQKILEEMTDIKIATIVVVTVAQEAMEIVRDLIIREDTNQTTKELIQG